MAFKLDFKNSQSMSTFSKYNVLLLRNPEIDTKKATKGKNKKILSTDTKCMLLR